MGQQLLRGALEVGVSWACPEAQWHRAKPTRERGSSGPQLLSRGLLCWAGGSFSPRRYLRNPRWWPLPLFLGKL